MHRATGQPVRTDFVQLTLVDPRGRFLMQERDEHAPVVARHVVLPRRWSRGRRGAGDGAARELAEETGIEVPPDALNDLGQFELVKSPHGTFRFHAFVAPYELGDRDVDCHEGRQMVFVDPPTHRRPRPGPVHGAGALRRSRPGSRSTRRSSRRPTRAASPA